MSHRDRRPEPMDCEGPYYPSHGHKQSCLKQEQIQRSLQASEQMLYDIYQNLMGMIEELEKHEVQGKSAGNSGLLSHVIPANKKKDKHDVTAIIVGQFACLDAQMSFAPPEVTEKVRMKMLDRTLMWVAARAEKGIDIGLVDCYAKNVVQLLTEPESMKLPAREKDPRPADRLDEQKVNDFLSQYAQARYQGEQQDKDFYHNPNKEAAMRNMKQGHSLKNGILRLLDLDRNDARFREALMKRGKDAMDTR